MDLLILNFISVHSGLSSDSETGWGAGGVRKGREEEEVEDAVAALGELGGLQVLQLSVCRFWVGSNHCPFSPTVRSQNFLWQLLNQKVILW